MHIFNPYVRHKHEKGVCRFMYSFMYIYTLKFCYIKLFQSSLESKETFAKLEDLPSLEEISSKRRKV